jgi:hypothetical protein
VAFKYGDPHLKQYSSSCLCVKLVKQLIHRFNQKKA